MAGPTRESDVLAIVFIGNFNPAIVHPAWLSRHGLVREEEAENAKVTIVAAELAGFSLGWVDVQVTAERFIASSEPAHQRALLDLCVGIFTLLSHTPIHRMGLNRSMHFRMTDQASWHALGHRLAPKEPWKGILDDPGMLGITMQGTRSGSAATSVKIKVAPSLVVNPGVYVETNEHYEREHSIGTASILALLRDSWENAQTYAQEAALELVRNRG